jgi:hypothetical protein
MSTLTLSKESFLSILPNLISSGVLFKAIEKDNQILIEFTGGY